MCTCARDPECGVTRGTFRSSLNVELASQSLFCVSFPHFQLPEMKSVCLSAALGFGALVATGRAALQSAPQWQVDVISRPSKPVLSFLDGNTAWPQSFNPSWVEASAGTAGKQGLLVRAQNCTGFTPGVCLSCNVNPKNPISPNSSAFPGSVITFAEQLQDGSFADPYVVFRPDSSAPEDESFGNEDPRLAYDSATGLYHLFYTCYGVPGAYLCHATTANPTAPYPGNWTRLGLAVPTFGRDSKSGALLIRPSPPHYLYWGAGVIHLATSDDLVSACGGSPWG